MDIFDFGKIVGSFSHKLVEQLSCCRKCDSALIVVQAFIKLSASGKIFVLPDSVRLGSIPGNEGFINFKPGICELEPDILDERDVGYPLVADDLGLVVYLVQAVYGNGREQEQK